MRCAMRWGERRSGWDAAANGFRAANFNCLSLGLVLYYIFSLHVIFNNCYSYSMPPFPNAFADPARDLPREAFLEIMRILRGALPPPADASADPMRRDRAAMAAVAALGPVNAAEGRLAAQFVAADAWAMDCLRLAGERRRETTIANKCRAQAMSLMREAKSSLRLLAKMQAARQALNEAASERAAWVEHATAGMLAEALAAEAPADEALADTSAADTSAADDGNAKSPPVFDIKHRKKRFETAAGRSQSPIHEAGNGERAPALSPRPRDQAAGAVAAV